MHFSLSGKNRILSLLCGQAGSATQSPAVFRMYSRALRE